MLLENKSDIRYVHYMMMYVLHVKWFLKELLVSLIMPLLSSKYVDEKINPFGNLISTRIKFSMLKPKSCSETETDEIFCCIERG
jgi:hypothetical protein